MIWRMGSRFMSCKVYQGIPVSKGIGIGKVYKYSREKKIVNAATIASDNIEAELQRYCQAKERANKRLKKIRDRAAQELEAAETKIFDAHVHMLNDPVLDQEIKGLIINHKMNSEAAVNQAIDVVIEKFNRLENNFFRERIKDIQDVGNHLLSALNGENTSLHDLPAASIILADDLTPSETALLDKDKLGGFVLSHGGETSHTAIMAKSLTIPAVVNIEGILEEVSQGDTIILDGIVGKIYLNPSVELLNKYRERLANYKKRQDDLLVLKDKAAVTIDGFEVQLAANIASEQELEKALEVNGDGIGLFRTEFLYMNNDDLKNEERQYNVYRKVLTAMAPKPVVVRALDIGGDKDLPYFDSPDEINPFLGWRGIRILLDRQDIFRTQLRALLRASTCGNLKIIFPMISSLEQLRKTKDLFAGVKRELESAGIAYNPNVETGIMIEVPATAVLAELFAAEVDFFSIGTNDLVQYTLAVDRNNSKIANLYSPYHPAVLKLINQVARAAKKNGIGVEICGEAAADPLLTPVFLGMGIRVLSMNPGSILEIKKDVRRLKQHNAEEKAARVLEFKTEKEIEDYLKNS
ncbi:phosphoenolpyruvate--protein phosphotransferase [Halocella sp. SP3-1]|nr:phosphoenolpyruvate--protein phosphotransferase [Halocella sp. SP3-1]